VDHAWDDEEFIDDDEYVEYVVNWDDLEPLPVRVVEIEALQRERPQLEWRTILDQLLADPEAPGSESAEFGRNEFGPNGFHVDDERRQPPLGDSAGRPSGDASRSPGRHSRSAD